MLQFFCGNMVKKERERESKSERERERVGVREEDDEQRPLRCWYCHPSKTSLLSLLSGPLTFHDFSISFPFSKLFRCHISTKLGDPNGD